MNGWWLHVRWSHHIFGNSQRLMVTRALKSPYFGKLTKVDGYTCVEVSIFWVIHRLMVKRALKSPYFEKLTKVDGYTCAEVSIFCVIHKDWWLNVRRSLHLSGNRQKLMATRPRSSDHISENLNRYFEHLNLAFKSPYILAQFVLQTTCSKIVFFSSPTFPKTLETLISHPGVREFWRRTKPAEDGCCQSSISRESSSRSEKWHQHAAAAADGAAGVAAASTCWDQPSLRSLSRIAESAILLPCHPSSNAKIPAACFTPFFEAASLDAALPNKPARRAHCRATPYQFHTANWTGWIFLECHL